MTDEAFLTAFEAGTLARKDWTHEAHVRIAWLYLAGSPSYREAHDRVRDGIRKLNAAFLARGRRGCLAVRPERSRSHPGLTGYHDTVTTAFVRLIAARLLPGEDFSAFRDRNPDLFAPGLPALLKHYTPERLFSDAAKREFLEPDLQPLPEV